VITAHDDGTYSLRLLSWSNVALQAAKAAPSQRMTWDPDRCEWVIWSGADRDAVISRLEALSYQVALRGPS
jgi:hypothetical protein